MTTTPKTTADTDDDRTPNRWRRPAVRLTVLVVAAGLTYGIMIVQTAQWTGTRGRVEPAPAGGVPTLVSVVEPKTWLDVSGWTAPDGEFMLLVVLKNEPHTLTVERPGCEPYTARGIVFGNPKAGGTPVPVPPCPGTQGQTR